MAKKPPVRVALDLETTGLHPEQDAILEVAAVKFQGKDIIDTFESFVAPGRAIPYRVQRLTGIKREQVTGAPHFDTIAKRLQAFLGDLPIVGHSIPFDVAFLRRRGIARTNPLIDTFEFASVMLPSLSSYNLGQVAATLGIAVPLDRHRAMVDTILAMEVFLVLHERLHTIDITLLKDLANLDAPRSWPLLNFFRQELRERQEEDGLQGRLARGSLGDRFAAQLGMDPRILSFAVARQPQAALELSSASTITPAEEATRPEAQGAQATVEMVVEQVHQSLPREYQSVNVAVRKALAECAPLLLEITTGENDYMPVLLPALEWLFISSTQKSDGKAKRLVIACATPQQARRLVETVLPRLQRILKSTAPVAYLAERGGYLCPHRWFGAALRRTSGELSAEQARGLAKLALWAQQTLTGERSELTLLTQEMTAWDRISSGVERIPPAEPRLGTIYERCTYRQKGYCFVSNAEERVKAAHIIVTTHMGLFDDLSLPPHQSLLAAIERRVILDTDLLEEENTRWGSSEFDVNRLLTLLNTIGVEMPNGRYQGLLALAAPSLHERGPGGLSTTPTIAKDELDAHLLSCFQTLRQARTAVEKLFLTFGRLLEDFMQQGSNGNGNKTRNDASNRGGTRTPERTDQPLRLSSQIRSVGMWVETERVWQQASLRLQAVIDMAREAEKKILTTQRTRHRLDIGSGEDSSVASELAAAAQHLASQKLLAQQAMSLVEGDTVYWLRVPPTPNQQQQRAGDANAASTPSPENAPVLYAQVVQTAALVKRLLLTKDTCTIFAGTALSVDNSFSYYRGRLGLDADTCPALSIVTDHHQQTLLYLPNDVPEPNTPQYQRHLDETLVQLASALEGQLAVLFTSHAALRSSYAAIKPVLESRDILVLGQGVDASPRQLWQMFQAQERLVVLGTGNFWDGLEEITRTPTCLFIARLPMPVLNDPPIAARAEQYSDQLHQLTIPLASLRIRRALNRVMWSDGKRNSVVLFDRRVTSKEYGSMVLNSIPHCSQRQGPASHMPETILDWLTAMGAWQ